MSYKEPPSTLISAPSNEQLIDLLSPLIGQDFPLTFAPRTDGANLRKLVSKTINIDKIPTLNKEEFEVIPTNGKGIPKLLPALIDTYLVTSGDNYNLQVWNRVPNSNSPLIIYNDGTVISASSFRFILCKVNTTNHTIESIHILTPQYIEDTFGSFGKPTIKSQLLISQIKRNEIISSEYKTLISNDTSRVKKHSLNTYSVPKVPFNANPTKVFSLNLLCKIIAKQIIGMTLKGVDTKNRGQYLERIVIQLLGYKLDERLAGGYPDIPNQLLEVKVQDTQTVDLGKYSPETKQDLQCEGFSTQDVRYLIALTEPTTHKIVGIVLASGEELGNNFTYVSSKSYKCQRSIPMSFFDAHKGSCLFNP